jgi:hypothetical protein
MVHNLIRNPFPEISSSFNPLLETKRNIEEGHNCYGRKDEGGDCKGL